MNSRWVFRDLPLVGRHVGHVGLVEPLDPELAVHVDGRLAQPLVLVLLERVLHVHRKQVPDRRGGQLKGGRGVNKSAFEAAKVPVAGNVGITDPRQAQRFRRDRQYENACTYCKCGEKFMQPTHVGNVELLRELVKDRRVARLVLLRIIRIKIIIKRNK